MKQHTFKTVLASSVLISTLLIVGCASKPTINNSRVYYVPEFYTVQNGDSLSKIAAKYGLNYLDIAQMNNIDAVDKIYVNQSLRLRGSEKSTPRLVKTTPIEQPVEIQRQSIATQAQNTTVPKQTTPVIPKQQTTTAQVITTNNQLKWVVPSNAPVTSGFDLNKNQRGIIFSGKTGDPIYAATAGEVVYADDGLKEYGKLVLLKHNSGYITAYAHNNRLLVKVGDKVATGQKIAEMGNTGASSTMLQFQIRLDGKPINPLTILPLN